MGVIHLDLASVGVVRDINTVLNPQGKLKSILTSIEFLKTNRIPKILHLLKNGNQGHNISAVNVRQQLSLPPASADAFSCFIDTKMLVLGI